MKLDPYKIEQHLQSFPVLCIGQKIYITQDKSCAHIDVSSTLIRTTKHIISDGYSRTCTVRFIEDMVDMVEEFRFSSGSLLWHVYTQQNWRSFGIISHELRSYTSSIDKICPSMYKLCNGISSLRVTYSSDEAVVQRLTCAYNRLEQLCKEFNSLRGIY
jgi:hypothetical protein